MKIAFLSAFSPEDRNASSGTNYKIAEQLKKYAELKWVPIKVKRYAKFFKYTAKGISMIFGKDIDIFSTKWGSRHLYYIIDKSAFEDCDIIAAFFCMPVLANLDTRKPIIYFTDATYPAMIGYYFKNRWAFNEKAGVELERTAMSRADALVLSSEWAANSAEKDLGQERNKIHIIEYGPNLDDKDILNDIQESFKNLHHLNMIFIGVDWERKGGDIAVDAAKWLNENGLSCTLHIVGIQNLSQRIKNYPFVVNHGFFNKNDKSDYDLYCKLISESNLELLPTKAECSAIAFSEAAAYGLPVFTHDTGGIANYVVNNVNGFRLPLGSTGEDFGRIILEAYNEGRLMNLSCSAHKLYIEKLNWNTWGKKVNAVLCNLMAERQIYEAKS